MAAQSTRLGVFRFFTRRKDSASTACGTPQAPRLNHLECGSKSNGRNRES